MAVWNSPPQGPQQQPTTTATTAATAGKAMNTAVAVVATAYNDKCKPAHEAAVQASLAVASVRSALTAYLRQGGPSQHHLPDLANLQPVEILSAGNSYRCVLPLWATRMASPIVLIIAVTLQQKLSLRPQTHLCLQTAGAVVLPFHGQCAMHTRLCI